MSTVLNAEPYGYSEKAIQIWKEEGYSYTETSWQVIDERNSLPGIHVLIVRLARKIDAGIINKFPDLQMIVSATTGHDHLDIETLKSKDIRLISLRGHDDFLKTIPSTAEHTWALLLALIRNIPAANDDIKKGNWNRDTFRGFQLKHKTLGIIGMGRTGNQVAKYASAFDMHVNYYDPYTFESNYTKCNTIEELLKHSDIVTLHVHLNAETENLLNETVLEYLKPGAFIVNTSRGKLIDEFKAYLMIRNGTIAGIATDVLAGELDNIKESPIWKAQQEKLNVIITPHIGGATWEAMWACEEFVSESLNPLKAVR